MNFEIKNIETFFPEETIQSASELVRDDLVQGISSLEKNLWTLKVGESFESIQKDATFEVEIQLSRKKVKAGTCDCDFYQQNKNSKNNFCKHIVAGLFSLRKHLLNLELKKQKSIPPVAGKHKKLTTISVLNSVQPEALKNFVRAYARTDKKFAIALKARFAHTVQLEDSKGKYIQLLQSTFNSVKTSKDKFNFQAVQQIVSVVNDILEQVDDAIALEHFSNAASILQAVILKVAPNIKRAEKHDGKMIHLIESAIADLNLLVKKDLPPELRKEIWEFCLEQSDGSEHKKYQTQHHFFQLLLELTNEKKAADIFINKIDLQLNFIFDKKKKGQVLLVKMKVLEKFYPKQLNSFVQNNMSEPEVLLAAIQKSILNKSFFDAHNLAKKGLEIQKSVLVKNKLENFLLTIAVKTHNQEEVIFYARKRFLVTYDFSYFNILKKEKSENWDVEVDLLLETIKKQPYTTHKKETLAILLASENRNGELINYLKKIRSLELLQTYDVQLLKDYKIQVCELYEDFLESYLRNHLGRQTSIKIREVFFHLNQIGVKKLVRKLTKQYREQFPERHTLMEELEIF